MRLLNPIPNPAMASNERKNRSGAKGETILSNHPRPYQRKITSYGFNTIHRSSQKHRRIRTISNSKSRLHFHLVIKADKQILNHGLRMHWERLKAFCEAHGIQTSGLLD